MAGVWWFWLFCELWVKYYWYPQLNHEFEKKTVSLVPIHREKYHDFWLWVILQAMTISTNQQSNARVKNPNAHISNYISRSYGSGNLTSWSPVHWHAAQKQCYFEDVTSGEVSEVKGRIQLGNQTTPKDKYLYGPVKHIQTSMGFLLSGPHKFKNQLAYPQ